MIRMPMAAAINSIYRSWTGHHHAVWVPFFNGLDQLDLRVHIRGQRAVNAHVCQLTGKAHVKMEGGLACRWCGEAL